MGPDRVVSRLWSGAVSGGLSGWPCRSFRRALRRAPRGGPASARRPAPGAGLSWPRCRHRRVAAGPSRSAAGSRRPFAGGHRAVWLSQRPDHAVDACVLYHAARGGDFSQAKAIYLAHFATDDPWVSAPARASMEKALTTAGCRHDAFDYPGTGHWFAQTAQAEAFDAAAAKRAEARDLAPFGQAVSRTAGAGLRALSPRPRAPQLPGCP